MGGAKRKLVAKRDIPVASVDARNESENDYEDSYESDAETDHLLHEQVVNQQKREAARRYLESLVSSSQLKKSLKVGNDGADEESEDAEDSEEVDAKQIDYENISQRLEKDILQASGKVFSNVAHEYDAECLKLDSSDFIRLKTGNHTPTCVAFSPIDKSTLFAGYKSGDVVEWNLMSASINKKYSRNEKSKGSSKLLKEEGSKAKGHIGHVLSVAVSMDGKYLISGGSDNLIIVWNVSDGSVATSFTSHRGPVTGLTIHGHTLFSASTDRTIKIWTLDQLAYVDTLFGHQDEILSVDCISGERCLSVGARDRTARLWKVTEETQLVFRGSEESVGSLDLISAVDKEHFVTGADTGAICLWALHRKKPMCTVRPRGEGSSSITALRSLKQSDLFVTGTADGLVSFWKIDTTDYRTFEEINSVQLKGCINDMVFSADGLRLAVVCGRDNRLGRWDVDKKAQNAIFAIDLNIESSELDR